MSERNTTTGKSEAKFEGTIIDNILVGPKYDVHREPVNISEIILETLKSKPDCVGQVDVFTNKKTTYADMSERSIKCGLWLKKQGVKSGDIIGICADNHLDAIIVFLGVMYTGAIANTWDHQLSVVTAKYYLSLMSPSIVFSISSSAAIITKAAEELNMNVKVVTFDTLDGYTSVEMILQNHNSREIDEFKVATISDPDYVAVIVPSSGTTGMQKAIEISHSSLHNHLYPPKIKNMESHVCMYVMTIRWYHGILLSFTAILAYATRIVVSPDSVKNDERKMNDNIFEYIEKYQISYLSTNPFMITGWIKTGALDKYRLKLKSLKKIVIAGSIFQKDHYEIIVKKLPNTLISNCYGITDCGGVITIQNEYSKPGSVGFPEYNVRIKIADRETGKALEANQFGEIRVKHPCVMNGYYKNPEATKRAFDSDGWLCSGDIGYYDEDGELFVGDRISEYILFRSINVSPAIIEAVLQSHPAVFKVVVIGIPHEIDEQHPMAIVSLIPGKTVTEEELISCVEKSLPDYCRLRGGVKIVDRIPMLTNAKIAKKKVKEMFSK